MGKFGEVAPDGMDNGTRSSGPNRGGGTFEIGRISIVEDDGGSPTNASRVSVYGGGDGRGVASKACGAVEIYLARTRTQDRNGLGQKNRDVVAALIHSSSLGSTDLRSPGVSLAAREGMNG